MLSKLRRASLRSGGTFLLLAQHTELPQATGGEGTRSLDPVAEKATVPLTLCKNSEVFGNSSLFSQILRFFHEFGLARTPIVFSTGRKKGRIYFYLAQARRRPVSEAPAPPDASQTPPAPSGSGRRLNSGEFSYLN
jgi:hypothetical protein